MILGSVFLGMGISDYVYPPEQRSRGSSEENGPAAYEKLILGMIMFIPGSYHTFLALMTFLGHEGYDYKDLNAFENDDFFNDE